MAELSTDVFSLEELHYLQVSRQVACSQSFGYFGSGQYPLPLPLRYSTVERIDFYNDTVTASTRGSLTDTNPRTNAVNGYFATGAAPYEKIKFENDTVISLRGAFATTTGNLFRQGAAVGNSDYGYFGGGTPGGVSIVERIDYSNDAAGVVKGPLSAGRRYLAATGNSSYGWFGGGSVALSTVDRIDYSNDTATASPRGPLSFGRTLLSATGNSDYGYFGASDTTPRAVVDRIDYSNDTATASPRGSLLTNIGNGGATGNSSYGYFGGGSSNPGSAPATVSQVNRIDFANDLVTASPRGTLTLSRTGLTGTSAAENGGYNSVRLYPITPEQSFPPAFYGYFGAGFTGTQISTVDRINYTNDTVTASVRGPLSVARYYAAAVGGLTHAYFAGGRIPTSSPVYSTIDRIEYVTDTATASVRGPLSSYGRFGATSAGNSSYGWIAGGATSTTSASPQSIVDRIDYSNDTATASPRGPLSASNYVFAATGNSDYGWFGGGQPADSAVDRIDYANDTATASPRGPLTVARFGNAATGNSSYGWFGGGATPTRVSTVDRIDYANDTATASPRGPLSRTANALGATGNNSFGWFGGGYAPGAVSVVDRIDYSNDTATASPRGPLSNAVYGHSAASAGANGLPQ